MSNNNQDTTAASSNPKPSFTTTGRSIVLCFDGTTNHFGAEKITNVIRIFELLSKDANRQLCYYQAGIGTYDTKVPLDSQTSSLSSQISKTFDAAFANGIRKHILGGYRFLMANYKQGDVIYMFGFSRGAYTARVLCGMLDKVGLLISGNEEQVSFAWKMYHGTKERNRRKTTSKDKEDSELLAEDFSRVFSQKVTVHFLGLWDTVRSTGPWKDPNLPEASDGFIRYFYHALALDERRAQFTPTLYAGRNLPDKSDETKDQLNSSAKIATKTEVREVWFAGDHCDVGGRFAFGNRTAASLANPSFRWIVRSAANMTQDPGLVFDFDALLKYYDILFYNSPSIMSNYLPRESQWYKQNLVTFSINDVWPDKLDFLCVSGHSLLKSQRPECDLLSQGLEGSTNSVDPSLRSMHARFSDVSIAVNQLLKGRHGFNFWVILHILTLHAPFGRPRLRTVPTRDSKQNKLKASNAEKKSGTTISLFGRSYTFKNQSRYMNKTNLRSMFTVGDQYFHPSVLDKLKSDGGYWVTAWSDIDRRITEVDLAHEKLQPQYAPPTHKSQPSTNDINVPNQQTPLIQTTQFKYSTTMNMAYSLVSSTHMKQDADWAIRRLTDTVRSTSRVPENKFRLITLLMNLGVWHFVRFQFTGLNEDLERSIGYYADAMQLITNTISNTIDQISLITAFTNKNQPLSKENRETLEKEAGLRKTESQAVLCSALCRSNYGCLLSIRYDNLERNEDLDHAITLHDQAQRAMQIWTDDVFFRRLHEVEGCLGNPTLLDKYSLGEELLSRELLDDLPAQILSNQAHSYSKKYELYKILSVLDDAISFQEQALASQRASSQKMSMRFYRLSLLYLKRSEHFSAAADSVHSTLDLYQAFDAIERASRESRDVSPLLNSTNYMPDRGVDQKKDFTTENLVFDQINENFNKAFNDIRTVLKNRSQQTGMQQSWWYHDTLARLHHTHFTLTNDEAYLRQAIDEQMKAIQLMPSEHPERSTSMSRYRILLVKGFNILSVEELDVAMREQRSALRAIPVLNGERHNFLHDLGLLLYRRFVLRPINLFEIDEAITVQKEALSLTPKENEHRAARLYDLSNSYNARSARLPYVDIECIRNAISNLESAINHSNASEENKRLWTSELAKRRRFQYIRFSQPADLNKAIDDYKLNLNLTKENLEKAVLLKALGKLLVRRFQYQGYVSDLEEAIDCYNNFLQIMPGDSECMDALRSAKFMKSTSASQQSSGKKSNPERLSEAIERLSGCDMPKPPADTTRYSRVERLWDLADLYLIRSRLFDDVNDVDKAMSTLTDVVESVNNNDSETSIAKAARYIILLRTTVYQYIKKKSIASADSDPGKLLGDIGNQVLVGGDEELKARNDVHSHTLEFSGFDELMRKFNETVKFIPESSSSKGYLQCSMGELLLARYGLTKSIRDFNIAYAKLRNAADLFSEGSAGEVAAAASGLLGNLFLVRFLKSNNSADLRTSESYLEKALLLSYDEQNFKPSILNLLGVVNFHKSLMATVDPIFMTRALTLSREALALTPNIKSIKASFLSNALKFDSARLRLLRNSGEFDKIVSFFREDVLSCIPDSHPKKVEFIGDLRSLAEELDRNVKTESTRKFFLLKLSGLSQGVLEIAKEYFQEGEVSQLLEELGDILERIEQAETIPVDNDTTNVKAQNLHTLALISLKRNKQRDDDILELEKATSLLREAIFISNGLSDNDDCLSKIQILTDLGQALNKRFKILGDREDLDEAIKAQKEAISLASSDQEKKLDITNDLACSLVTRFEYFRDPAQLEKAISLHEEVVQHTSTYHPDYHKYLHGFSLALIRRVRRIAGEAPQRLIDIEKAISLLQDATRLLPASHQKMPLYLRDIQFCKFLRSQMKTEEQSAVS